MFTSAQRALLRTVLCFLCLAVPFSAQAASHAEAAGTDTATHVTIQRGKASYLGKKFQGRKTANGEIFRHEKLTAAHKTLPFGTVLRVTRLTNGRSVIVRVNDRGPFIKGRFVDLSRLAASKLNMLRGGVTEVQFEIITNRHGEPLLPDEAFYVALARGDSAEAARKQGEALGRTVPAKHAAGLKKTAVFALNQDPGLPGYVMGLGPFARFEDAHRAFLALPAKTGHEIICAAASLQE